MCKTTLQGKCFFLGSLPFLIFRAEKTYSAKTPRALTCPFTFGVIAAPSILHFDQSNTAISGAALFATIARNGTLVTDSAGS